MRASRDVYSFKQRVLGWAEWMGVDLRGISLQYKPRGKAKAGVAYFEMQILSECSGAQDAIIVLRLLESSQPGIRGRLRTAMLGALAGNSVLHGMAHG